MPEAEVFFALFLAATTAFGITAAALWVKLRRLRQVELELARFQGHGASLDAPNYETTDQVRLAQLEQSHDTMAAQLDRVLEGQQFLTRILAERHDAARVAAPRPAESVTPH